MTDVSATGRSSSDDDPQVLVTASVLQEIADAYELMEYAIETGFVKPTTNETLAEDVVTTIKVIAAKAGYSIGAPDSSSAERPTLHLKASEWAKLELAYYKLTRFMSPVTAQTLRDTSKAGKGFGIGSPAERFAILLSIITIAFAVFIVVVEWGLQRFAPVQEGEVDTANTIMQFAQILIPWAYGGLGSCAYLLRSAHTYIHERTFNIRRKPEYFNRIILGTISGGAIILFVNYVSSDGEGTTIKLSSAALGFLGGYSTDFLFNTIERVVTALLPKIGIQTIRQDAAPPKAALDVAVGGLTLKELLERFDKAQGPDKDMYKSLIDKLRGRM